MTFQDRKDAGTKLHKLLIDFKNKDINIIGIPRGGIIIADIVSQLLHTEMDIIFTKKLPAPQNKEFAIGAVAQDKTLFLDNQIINENEIVFTSGDGGYFNSGIPIGITRIENGKTYVIPTNNLEELQYLQIFLNNFKSF